jgi:hypothetical protein
MHRPIRTSGWSASARMTGLTALAVIWLAACGGAEDRAENLVTSGDVSDAAASDAPAVVEPKFDENVIAAPEEQSPGMHVHGIGEFAAAIDGETLVLSLRSPMYNLVGFERAAETPEEEAELVAAKALLRAPDGLFELPEAAGCTFTGAEFTFVEAPLGRADHDHDHGDDDHDHDHEHDEDDHDHGDDDHGEDDHDHGEEEDSAESTGAAAEPGLGDLIADWRYACAEMDRLDGIDVVLFDEFERFEELTAIAIADDTVTADLTPASNRLDMPG